MSPAGNTIDYDTYLTQCGKADIFFPTDFDAAAKLYSSAAAAGSSRRIACGVHDVSDFMYTFADWKSTSTVGGFNPLLQDFTNTKILLGGFEPTVRRFQ